MAYTRSFQVALISGALLQGAQQRIQLDIREIEAEVRAMDPAAEAPRLSLHAFHPVKVKRELLPDRAVLLLRILEIEHRILRLLRFDLSLLHNIVRKGAAVFV